MLHPVGRMIIESERRRRRWKGAQIGQGYGTITHPHTLSGQGRNSYERGLLVEVLPKGGSTPLLFPFSYPCTEIKCLYLNYETPGPGLLPEARANPPPRPLADPPRLTLLVSTCVGLGYSVSVHFLAPCMWTAKVGAEIFLIHARSHSRMPAYTTSTSILE